MDVVKKCKYSKCENYFEPRKNGVPQLFCKPTCQWKNRNEIHPEHIKQQNMKVKTKLKKRIWKENKNFNGNATLINKECFICKSKEKLLIHHVDGNNGKQGKSLNNESSNLVILCRICHPTIHNKWWRKEILCV